MNNKEAIEILQRYSSIPNEGEDFEYIIEAYDMAIESLKNEKPKFITSADERIKTMKHLVHVTINDPKYGEVDGWLDPARQLLFTDAVSTEFAKKVYGWTWKEADNDN